MIDSDFRKRNMSMWRDVVTAIFPVVPEEAIWTSQEDIISVLSRFAEPPYLNHMFYPMGGGNDLEGVSRSAEENCVELIAGGGIELLRPKSLQFVCISGDVEWSYLRIDSLPLKPCGIYESDELRNDDETPDVAILRQMRETVVEVGALDYRDINQHQRGFMEYNALGEEVPYPKDARIVTRFFKGSFVIFPKSSEYNAFSQTYDGRHNDMSAAKFKEYVAGMREVYVKHRKG